MFIHDDEKGHVIIGEAALSLALAMKEINLNSLIAELGHMAGQNISDARLGQISEARRWLRTFDSPDVVVRHLPYLQTLAGLNDDKN